MLANEFQFLVGIGSVAVESNYHFLSIALEIADMTVEVLQTYEESFFVRFLDMFHCHASVQLESLGGGNDDGQLWLETCLATFDVVELLSTEVGTEACLCDDVVTISHCQFGSEDGVAAVCNVGERTSMHESRCLFRGLHEVWMEGIHE